MSRELRTIEFVVPVVLPVGKVVTVGGVTVGGVAQVRTYRVVACDGKVATLRPLGRWARMWRWMTRWWPSS